MGVYDYQIGQQAARFGNAILPIEVDVLTQGGEVLIIEPLPAWDNPPEGYGNEAQTDQDGDVVFVPLLVKAMDPRTVVAAGFDYQSQTETKHRLIDELVQERGDAVLKVPSYIGVIDEQQTHLYHPGHDWRTENPGVWRYWDGMPVTDANRDAVKAIMTLGTTRITGSHWEQLCWLAQMGDGGDCATADVIWLYVTDPKRLDSWGEQAAQEYVEWEGDEDALQTAIAYQEMVDLGFLWDGTATTSAEPYPKLEFDHMDAVLRDYPDAVSLWNTLIARRARASARYLNSQVDNAMARYQEDTL